MTPRRLTLIALAVVAVPVAYYNYANNRDHYATLPAIGSRVPDFDFPLVSGGRVSPETLEGTPAVIVLWATDCWASRQALEGTERLHTDYAPRGAGVVVLADDSDERRLRGFVDSAAVDVPVAFTDGLVRRVSNSDAWFSATANTALPTFLIVDSSGRIAKRFLGVAAPDTTGLTYPFREIRASLDSLLLESSAPRVRRN